MEARDAATAAGLDATLDGVQLDLRVGFLTAAAGCAGDDSRAKREQEQELVRKEQAMLQQQWAIEEQKEKQDAD